MGAETVLWGLLGYLSGSLPWGYIIARLRGVNIREHGSGNIGAANVARTLGAPYGVLVGVLDFLKGFIPTYFAFTLYGPFTGLVTGVLAVVGAIFSVFLGFRGGKGFSCAFGAFVAMTVLTGQYGALAALLTIWFTIVLLTQMTGLANIVTIVAAVPVTALAGSPVLTAYTLAVAILVMYSHRDNIILMLQGDLESQRLDHRGKRRIRMG